MCTDPPAVLSMAQAFLNPRLLVANRHHTLCIDDRIPKDKGAVYAWGGGEPDWSAQDEPLVDAKKVAVLVSPSKGDADGSGSSGRPMLLHHLGLGEATTTVPIPRPRVVGGLTEVRIVEVSAGLSHTLLRSHGGDVYSCGIGLHGQLGHGTQEYVSTPKFIEARAHGGLQLDRHGRAVMVSAGRDHSLVLTEQGFVYSFGSGTNGRHGHGETTNTWNPKPIAALDREFIRAIEAGSSHSFVINRAGDLFAWGAGGSGQLGLGHADATYQQMKPTMVEFFSLEQIDVRQASAGGAHSLVVTTTGELYSFGFGAYGRLGHGDREDVHLPKRIEGPLTGHVVKDALAGLEHSVVLTERGQVYTFGNDAHGKLGHGNKASLALPHGVRSHLDDHYGPLSQPATYVQEVYAFGPNRSDSFGERRDIAVGHGQDYSLSLPMRVEALLAEEVVAIAVGDHHTVVMIGDDKDGAWSGELRAFGCNQSGQLGLPWLTDEGDHQLPTRVEWPPTRNPEDWEIDEAQLLADQSEEAARRAREQQALKPATHQTGRRSSALEREQHREEASMSAADRMLAKAMEMEATEAERRAREDAAKTAKLKRAGITSEIVKSDTTGKVEIELPPPPPKGWYPVSKN